MSQPTRDKSLLMVATVPPTLYGFLLPIARRMREAGWRVDGAACGIAEEPRCAGEFDHVFDVDWSRNPFDPSNLSSAVSRIRSIVSEGGHRVVHVHTPVAAFVTRLALRRVRAKGDVRVVYTAHGFHFHERQTAARNAAFLGAEKLAGRWTDRLVLINEYDVAQALRHHIVPPHRVVYMHGIGIDIDAYDPTSLSDDDAEQIRASFGLNGHGALFVVPAEFIERKRQSLVVKALAMTRRPDIHVAFVGTGPTLDRVKQEADEAGVAENAHFLGWRDDVARLMKAADGTVLFSQQEGLSRAVMESLAMECPVIGSDIRGIRELLADGCGVPVNPDRWDLLAQAMVMLAEDKAWGEAMGRAGRAKMAGPYEQDRIVEAHRSLYEGVLAHG